MIKNLLFDLGGVIMDIEKDNCVRAYERLGLEDARSFFGEFSQKGPFMQLEAGQITPAEFHAALRPHLPQDVTDEQIDEAFCQFLTGIPRHRLEELRQLRERYRIYMLSNTNPIMWDSRIRSEFEQEGLRREDYFDGIVTSFEAKALKPAPRIFEYAIEKYGLKPSETLFLDDSESNLSGASAMGFKTAHVAQGREFIDIIDGYEES